MKKTQFIGAASSVSIVAGVLAAMMFSDIGFSLAVLMSPSFYFGLFEKHLLQTVLGIALLGVSLGSLFSATRFLGALRAAGLAAIVSLIVTLTGSLFFWGQMTSYTVVALGCFLGTAAAGFLSSKARGSKFGVGFEYAKKAMIAASIVALLGTMVVVALDPEPHSNQFISGVTGVAVMGMDIDDETIDRLVREENPKMEWDEFRAQIAADYDSYGEADKAAVQKLYDDYSADYEAGVAAAVQETQGRLVASEETADTLVRSTSFFELILDNIAIAYGIMILTLFLPTGMLLVAPVAGATSLALHRLIPKAAHPKPKEKMEPMWDEEIIRAQDKRLKKLEEKQIMREARRRKKKKK